MDLSFSGAGFMGCYYFGVVNCWDKYIPRERVRRVAGASAGSLIAAYYLMDLPMNECLKEIIAISEEARSKPLGVFDRSNQIVDVLPRALDKLFPEDAHKRVNGRLYVCMTRLRDLKSVVVNEFETRKDLIDALNCSCFIPVWSGNHVSTYKGVKYIDGGFTNNMPVFDEHTIRVSCFAGGSDIAPYDRARMEMLKTSLNGMSVYLSWRNFRRARRALWPPPVNFIIQLLEQGFHDTKEFILSNDLIQCDRCFRVTERQHQLIYSRITPTISPASSPAVSRAPSLLNLADLQRNGGDCSFRLHLSKRGSKEKSPKSKQNNEKGDNWKPPPLPPVRIKEHRRQSATGFETDRNKSGKQIDRKALERLRLESEGVEEEADHDHEEEQQQKQGSQVQPGFASKLREKLQQVAAVRSTGPQTKRSTAKGDLSSDNNKNGYDTGEQRQQQQQPTTEPVPTINVEQPPPSAVNGERAAGEGQEAPGAELTRSSEHSSASELKLRTSSLSSSASNDSAVVLETPCSSSVMSGSPAEKYLAGAKQRAQSLSLAHGTNLLTTISPTKPADRFSLAPSPLPSCPPSPNLNRHCTECIRLRQQARADGIDESVRQAAELFSNTKSKEPEREFSSIKWKLACWLRQIGPAKYSYSFKDDEHESMTSDENIAGTPPSEDDCETMAERKARRKASHPLAWPMLGPTSEIQAIS